MADASPPLPFNACNCSALRKASRRLSQVYDAALAPSGLKSTQFGILAEIARQGTTPPTMRALAEAMAMDRSTLGQNLRPLERDGLISLETGEDDRRRRYMALTKKGRTQLATAQVLWRRAQSRFEDAFGRQAAADLRDTLLGIVTDPSLAAD